MRALFLSDGGACASQVVRGGSGDPGALKGIRAQEKLSKPERQLAWNQTEESFRQDAVFIEPTFDDPPAASAEEGRADSAVKGGHGHGAEPAVAPLTPEEEEAARIKKEERKAAKKARREEEKLAKDLEKKRLAEIEEQEREERAARAREAREAKRQEEEEARKKAAAKKEKKRAQQAKKKQLQAEEDAERKRKEADDKKKKEEEARAERLQFERELAAKQVKQAEEARLLLQVGQPFSIFGFNHPFNHPFVNHY